MAAGVRVGRRKEISEVNRFGPIEWSFATLTVLVTLDTSLIRWSNLPPSVAFLVIWIGLSSALLCFGIVCILVAEEKNSQCDQMRLELEHNAPWPQKRWQELDRLIRRLCKSESLVRSLQWEGSELCKTGMVFGAAAILVSPFITLFAAAKHF